ncbi:unnamed protein product [Rhodiola kirilowii]
MEHTIKAREEGQPSGIYEKARLRFAHAETIVAFSCLLGLFLDGSEGTAAAATSKTSTGKKLESK